VTTGPTIYIINCTKYSLKSHFYNLLVHNPKNLTNYKANTNFMRAAGIYSAN